MAGWRSLSTGEELRVPVQSATASVGPKVERGPRPPSLREELRNIVNLLPDDYRIDQKTMVSLIEQARTSYDAKTRGEYGLREKAIATPFNADELRMKEAESAAKIGSIGYRDQQYGALNQARIGDLQARREQQQPWWDARAGAEGKRGDLYTEQGYTEQAQQDLIEDKATKVRRETDQIGEITPYQQKRIEMESPYWQGKADAVGQPARVPVTPAGGGGRAPQVKPYEVQEDEYVFKGLDEFRKTFEPKRIQEAEEGKFFKGLRGVAQMASVRDAEVAEEQRLRDEFRQRFPRQPVQPAPAATPTPAPTPDPQLQQLLQRADEIRRRLQESE